MINVSVLQDNLMGLVGWNQPTDPSLPVINTTNNCSESGLYFDSVSSLVTIKNIINTQEYKDISENDFNTLLTRWQKEAIAKVCNNITVEKSKMYESCTLFPYEQNFQNTETPGNGFVGIKIDPYIDKAIMMKICSIGIAFNSAQTFYIYVFSSERRDTLNYLYRQQVTAAANEVVKYSVNWDISLSKTSVRTTTTNNYNTLGGSYYIGYYEADLNGAEPYVRDFEGAPIYYGSDYHLIEFGRYNLSGTKINPQNYSGISDPYGINIEYSTYTDYTEQLIQNKHLLSRAIQLQMAERVIENILTSTRSNIQERLTDDIVNVSNYTLNDPKVGIRKELNDEIMKLKKMFFPKKPIINSTLR